MYEVRIEGLNSDGTSRAAIFAMDGPVCAEFQIAVPVSAPPAAERIARTSELLIGGAQ